MSSTKLTTDFDEWISNHELDNAEEYDDLRRTLSDKGSHGLYSLGKHKTGYILEGWSGPNLLLATDKALAAFLKWIEPLRDGLQYPEDPYDDPEANYQRAMADPSK